MKNLQPSERSEILFQVDRLRIWGDGVGYNQSTARSQFATFSIYYYSECVSTTNTLEYSIRYGDRVMVLQ